MLRFRYAIFLRSRINASPAITNKSAQVAGFAVKDSQKRCFCSPAIWALYETRMKEWCDVKEEFEPEGSLRDIYIEDIDESVWDQFIDSILDSAYELKFTHGQKIATIPRSFNEIRQLQKSDPTTLGIVIENGIRINCHFFVESEIELDLSPREIDSENKFKSLISFLSWVNVSLCKPVKLTHENAQTEVILCLS